MRRRSLRTVLCGIWAVAGAAGCVRAGLVTSSPVFDIFAVLRDSIRKGGDATRVVPAPARSYQHPAAVGAIDELAAVLGLSISPQSSSHPSCRWSPADLTSIGMDVTVTEFDVVGDSAKVSVLRECVERTRGRVMTSQFEPTWFLKRRDGRWIVIGGVMRVTDRPDKHPRCGWLTNAAPDGRFKDCECVAFAFI
jgi:hypothetical protein